MAEVFGVVGWKNSGKTTLVGALVAELCRRGLSVSTIKHAHDGFEIDQPGTDSRHHRDAGAQEVAIVSDTRWALIHEVPSASAAPSLEGMIKKLARCDVILFEGFKSASYPKIEVRGDRSEQPHLWRDDKNIIAVASDDEFGLDACPQPTFARSDVVGIVNYLSDMGSLQE